MGKRDYRWRPVSDKSKSLGTSEVIEIAALGSDIFPALILPVTYQASLDATIKFACPLKSSVWIRISLFDTKSVRIGGGRIAFMSDNACIIVFAFGRLVCVGRCPIFS